MRRKHNDEIFTLLENDHRAVAALFAELERTTERAGRKRAKLFEMLSAELGAHADAEEQAIYPHLQGVKQTAELGFEAEEEHGVMKHLLQKLAMLDPTEERWLPTLTVLKQAVERHVEREESTVFRAMRRILDREELEVLARDFQIAKSGELPLRQAV